MLKNFDIICFSTMDWDAVWGSRQALMSKLSKHNRIYFIQQQIGPEHILKHPQFIKKIFRLLFRKITQLDKNIFLIEPIIQLPGNLLSFKINKINQKLSYLYFSYIFKKLKLKNKFLWFFNPYLPDLIGKFDEVYSLYYCIDFFSALSTGNKKKVIDTLEKQTIEKTKLTVTITQKLYDDKKKIAKNIEFVYNGCDYEKIREIMTTDNIAKPDELKNINTPILGHMGSITSKINLDLIEFLATRNPQWTFVFIGEIFYADIDIIKINKLKQYKNILFLGAKTREQVYVYEKFFDVCLNIYVLNSWTEYFIPLKLYEYFSTGKPIVSTYLPELTKFQDILYLSNDFVEFEENIKKCLNGERKGALEMQLSIGKSFSWENILIKIANRVQQNA